MDRPSVDAFLAASDGVLNDDSGISGDAMRWSPDGAGQSPRPDVLGFLRDAWGVVSASELGRALELPAMETAAYEVLGVLHDVSHQAVDAAESAVDQIGRIFGEMFGDHRP